MTINFKKWDSDFFGYPISEIRKEVFTSVDFEKVIELAKGVNAQLVYLVSNEESEDLVSQGCFLADIKVTYRRKVEKNVILDEHISSFSSNENYEELVDLALASGEYSRFKTDPKFIHNEFEKLYIEWIKKSVDRILADDVYIFKTAKHILGMVTAKINGQKADIGLIAVDIENRGHKIGKKLIDAVNNYALNNGCSYIDVPTQKLNYSACNFYEKNGFSIEKIEYIYHLWLNK